MDKISIKNRLYKFSWLFGEKFHNVLMYSYLMLTDFKRREHLVHLGPLNPEITIYCIRYYNSGEGLLSIFSNVMARIEWADQQGYIPYVDIDQDGEASMFNRYFRVKTNLSKDEVYKSKNVLFSGWNAKKAHPGWGDWMSMNDNEQKKAVFDKYIEFTDEILEKVKIHENKIPLADSLGLFLRGTNYVNLRPFGHPVQPTLDEVKDSIDRILLENHLEKIFLVTEDERLFQRVIALYGQDKVITISNDHRYGETGREQILDYIRTHEDVETSNVIYLVKIILLSKCASFVGGITNGSIVANALNGDRYRQRFVFDVGLYK